MSRVSLNSSHYCCICLMFSIIKSKIKKNYLGSSLVVQWLGLGAFTDVALGSIPGRGTKIPQAMWCG